MNALALILVTVCALGCAGSTDSGGPTPLSIAQDPTLEPLATEAPAFETPASTYPSADTTAPSPESTAKPLVVKVTARPKTVRRNGTTSVTIRTTPGSTCGIDVQYSSGSSTASGLGDKKTGTTGSIVWTWRIGSNTSRGTWPVVIRCHLRDRAGSVSTSVTVK